MTTKIENKIARRIFMQRHGLTPSPKLKGLSQTLDHLGFVQIDSVNTLARAHDLILWNRDSSYNIDDLFHAKNRGTYFESWTHDAAALPLHSYPHWKHKFAQDKIRLERQWKSWRRGDFLKLCDGIKDQIAKNGPQCTKDVGTNEAKSSGGWWDWHPSKTALEYLWRSGDLTVCHRSGFRKYYDFAENHIPGDDLKAETSWHETLDWACEKALEHLGFATAKEIADFWDLVPLNEAKQWVEACLSDGRIVPVNVENADKTLATAFMRVQDLDALDATHSLARKIKVISPFDPMIRDRKRAKRLFGFEYTIEIFVPAAKRKYGYYVFPILKGDRFVGRIDMKRDGKTRQLNVLNMWWEKPSDAKHRDQLEAALKDISRFGECDAINGL